MSFFENCFTDTQQGAAPFVALLAEGVDRNKAMGTYTAPILVALLAEGVDRNISRIRHDYVKTRRPPRGGRG